MKKPIASTATNIIVSLDTTDYTDAHLYTDLLSACVGTTADRKNEKAPLRRSGSGEVGKAGGFDRLGQQALRDHELGLTIPFPCRRFMGFVWHHWTELKRFYLRLRGVVIEKEE